MKKVYGFVAVLFVYMFTAGWVAAQTNQNSCYYTCIGDVNQAPGQLSGSLTCQQAADYCADYAINKALPGILTKFSFEIYPLSQTSGRLTCAYNLTYTNSQGTQSHAQYSGAGLNGQCTTPPTCTPPAELINGQCVTPPPICAPPSVLSGNQCVCPAPNALVNGVCTKCPVDGLTALGNLSTQENEDAATRALTEALEAGKNGYDLLSQTMKTGEQCLSADITGRGITYSGPTSTVRTVAYQKHLREIWDKFIKLQKVLEDNPGLAAPCQSLINQLEAEMGFKIKQNPEKDSCNGNLGRNHCIKHRPAGGADGKHTKNNAIDIASSTVDALEKNLAALKPAQKVSDVAKACGVSWGGDWTAPENPDLVHFYLP